jgi:comEA protein
VNTKKFLVNHAFFLLGGTCLIIAGIIYAINLGEEPRIVRATETESAFLTEESPLDIDDRLININTASLEELQTLSGIGPVIAQRIIDMRETCGGFSHADELIYVSGIGDVILERIRGYITIG